MKIVKQIVLEAIIVIIILSVLIKENKIIFQDLK